MLSQCMKDSCLGESPEFTEEFAWVDKSTCDEHWVTGLLLQHNMARCEWYSLWDSKMSVLLEAQAL